MPHCTRVRQVLKARGYRATPQRLLVLEVLETAGRHLSAEEVHAALQARYPTVDLSTVYRTLDLFVSLGLVAVCDLGAGRRFYEPAGRPDHGHFRCQGCGAVLHFDDALLEPLRTALAERHGFQVQRLSVTVQGRCPACQGRPLPGGG